MQSVSKTLPRSAAVYLRLSSTHDDHKKQSRTAQGVETSLETQLAGCKEKAKARGDKVRPEAIFRERYTGAELHMRPVLSELRDRIKAKEFQVLYVWDDDRLARDPVHIALLMDEFERAHCELVFVTSTLENTDEGRLVAYIRGYASKLERLRIKDRMMRAKGAIVAAGKMVGNGVPLYGYQFDPVNRVRVIDESTAAIVRDIFRWLDEENMSLRAVRDRLITMRVPCPGEVAGFRRKLKSHWSTATLAKLAKNKAYIGITRVQRSRATEERIAKSGKYRSEAVPEIEWKTLPDTVTPAIISREVFDRVGLKLEANRKRSDYTRNSHRPVLLRGLLYCGECASVMYPVSQGTHKDGYVRRTGATYCCSDKRKTHRPDERRNVVCSAKRLSASDVETRVWDKLITFLIDPELVEREVKRVLVATPDNHMATDLAAAQKQLAGAKRLRDAALDKYEDAIAEDDADLAARWDAKAKTANSDVRALADVAKQIESRMAAYRDRGKTAKAFKEKVRAFMSLRPEDYTFEEKRAALQALAIKVYACSCHGIKIELNTGVLANDAETVTVAVMV